MPPWPNYVSLLGGSNVQSSAPEVRDILEKGVAEAVTFPWGSVPLFGIDKVTKYHIDAPLYATTFAFVFSPTTYNQMSAAQKKVIDDHCTNEWALRVATPWADYEHAGVAKLKADPAHEVYPLTPEQLAEWKKAAEPLEKAWAANVKKAGGDPDAIMKELRDSLSGSSTRPIDRAAFAGDRRSTAGGILPPLCREDQEQFTCRFMRYREVGG